MSFVIKSWRADFQADQKGRFVTIEGRQAGIIPWFLSLVGIDPTVHLKVFADKLTFEVGSLSGMNRRIIPLAKVCSTFYGYSKPWKEALALVAMGIFFWSLVGDTTGFLGFLLLFGLGFGYYALNKELALAVVEDSGVSSLIEFKRSIIENQNIDEQQAEKVVLILSELIDRNLSIVQKFKSLENGIGNICSNCHGVKPSDGDFCETCGAKANAV